jgi:hypothetical protein
MVGRADDVAGSGVLLQVHAGAKKGLTAANFRLEREYFCIAAQRAEED